MPPQLSPRLAPPPLECFPFSTLHRHPAALLGPAHPVPVVALHQSSQLKHGGRMRARCRGLAVGLRFGSL